MKVDEEQAAFESKRQHLEACIVADAYGVATAPGPMALHRALERLCETVELHKRHIKPVGEWPSYTVAELLAEDRGNDG